MVQKMKELQREEELQNEKKKQFQKKVNEEIVTTNKNAILIIEQRKAKEIEEEEKITAYIKEKADKQAEMEAEQKYLLFYVDASRSKKKRKSKSSDNFKKKLQTGRPNSMH